ncbi:MAG TPA: NDP-sugar synthase, partial [Thermoanaerobaculia bacterium]|nr:NDP-sugar synthase [Thermoanaerobaculia bacterium]
MRALLLAAGRGIRFRPITERIPKPLFPYLNVPLARAHLARLRRFGIREAAVNLHHLGEKIEQHLIDRSSELPKLRFFPEPEILGTAGALRNAADFLSEGDFLVVNSDAAIEPDYAALVLRHRESGRPATLLVVENREPDRYTPLQSEGDRITGFGGESGGTLSRGQSGGTLARRQSGGTLSPAPLLYTGVSVLSPRVLPRIPSGETSLVHDLWDPLLRDGEEIGWMRHEGPFADLGRPSDFLRASLEALERGGPFPEGAGSFEGKSRTLVARPAAGFEVSGSVLGDALIGKLARVNASVVWEGTSIGAGARL